MNFTNSIRISKMTDEATNEFRKLRVQLSRVEEVLTEQKSGRSPFKIWVSIFFSLVWLAAAYGLYHHTEVMYSDYLLLGCGALVLFMLLDHLSNLRHLGKIMAQGRKLNQLRDRLDRSERSMASDLKKMLASEKKGWNYKLDLEPSIYKDSEQVMEMLKNIQALREGFLQKLKTFLYYLINIAFILAAFLWYRESLYDFTANLFDGDSFPIAHYIATGLACLIQIFLAKAFWGMTDCKVTNRTLWAIPLGILNSALLNFGGGLLVFAIIWAVNGIISLISAVFSFVVVCACLYCFCSGG